MDCAITICLLKSLLGHKILPIISFMQTQSKNGFWVKLGPVSCVTLLYFIRSKYFSDVRYHSDLVAKQPRVCVCEQKATTSMYISCSLIVAFLIQSLAKIIV